MSTALVIGATGSAGTPIVDALAARGQPVIAVARHIEPDPRPTVTALAVDAADREALVAALDGVDVHTLYFAARERPDASAVAARAMTPTKARRLIAIVGAIQKTLGWVPGLSDTLYRKLAAASRSLDPGDVNLAMLQNSVDAAGPALDRVVAVTGAMYYGMHLGPTLYPEHPFPYDDTQHGPGPGPSWYVDVERWLARQERGWTWTVLRPTVLASHAIAPSSELGMTLVMYAALCKAQGRPALFPGDATFQALRWSLSSGRALGEMATWAASAPATAGRAFNSASGDTATWREIWTRLAEHIGVEPVFEDNGHDMAAAFEGANTEWATIAARAGLDPLDLDRACTVDAIRGTWVMNWDVGLTMSAAREAGFTDIPRTVDVLPDLVDQLRGSRSLPTA